MRAGVYQKLHEFNLHMEEGIGRAARAGAGERGKRGRGPAPGGWLEELRGDASGYLSSIFSDQEERESGRLFVKRRRREMAEDPMHGGWLEEKREKLRKSRGPEKKEGR